MDNEKEIQTPATDQNIGQTSQPDNSGNYSQYIDPDYQKKQKNKKILLITGIIVAALLIIMAAAAVALLAGSDGDSQTTDNSPAKQICDGTPCFEVNFQTCTPSEYTYQEGDISTVKYKVLGQGEIGCSIEMQYITSKYQPEIQGKSMVCDFDNTIDLDSAVQNVLDYPDDYACEGELAEFIKTPAT